MLKRIITLLLALCIMFATSFAFASNNAGSETQDSLNKAGDSVRNFVDDTGNAISGGADAIGNGIKDLGNTFSAGAARVTNDDSNNNNAGTYTTARTSADSDGFAGMSRTTWLWFIIAIATVAIVALVWYYAMQNDVNYRKNNND